MGHVSILHKQRYLYVNWRLNMYGDETRCLVDIANPAVGIRRSWDNLIFKMGFPKLVSAHVILRNILRIHTNHLFLWQPGRHNTSAATVPTAETAWRSWYQSKGLESHQVCLSGILQWVRIRHVTVALLWRMPSPGPVEMAEKHHIVFWNR